MIFKGLSLFANVGIGETYLKDIGYPIVVANELLKDRCEFYQHQNDHPIIQGDITNADTFNQIIDTAKKLGVNFILATPPCQGMSLLGKQESSDPRNLLITHVVNAIKLLNPEFILIENVPQMYETKIDAYGTGEILSIKEYLLRSANELGYNINFNIYNAADYGTPQHRKRAFTKIYKKSYQWEEPIKQEWITVDTAIGYLPSLKNGEKTNILHHNAKKHSENEILWLSHTPSGCSSRDNEIHFPKTVRMQKQIINGKPSLKLAKFPLYLKDSLQEENSFIENKVSIEILKDNKPTGKFKEVFVKDYFYEEIKEVNEKLTTSLPEYINEDGTPAYQPMKGFKSTYSRMSWDKPAPAITMNNGSLGGQQNGHPGRKLENGLYSDARVLTHLELFRLMGLPDNWNVPDWASDSMIRHVIGEAIPPRLTMEIVKCLKINT